MKNKTCGECKHYIAMSRCILYRQFVDDDDCCDSYTPKPQPSTNGDVIRQMSNEELLRVFEESCGKFSSREEFLDWLNAPAESEGEE